MGDQARAGLGETLVRGCAHAATPNAARALVRAVHRAQPGMVLLQELPPAAPAAPRSKYSEQSTEELRAEVERLRAQLRAAAVAAPAPPFAPLDDVDEGDERDEAGEETGGCARRGARSAPLRVASRQQGSGAPATG